MIMEIKLFVKFLGSLKIIFHLECPDKLVSSVCRGVLIPTGNSRLLHYKRMKVFALHSPIFVIQIFSFQLSVPDRIVSKAVCSLINLRYSKI